MTGRRPDENPLGSRHMFNPPAFGRSSLVRPPAGPRPVVAHSAVNHHFVLDSLMVKPSITTLSSDEDPRTGGVSETLRFFAVLASTAMRGRRPDANSLGSWMLINAATASASRCSINETRWEPGPRQSRGPAG